MVGLLAVLLINGAPLFYFDTAGYLRQGDSIFQILGLFPDAIAAQESVGALATNDGIVIGSRSVIYAIFLSVISLTGTLWSGVVAQASVLVAVSLLISVKAMDMAKVTLSAPRVTAISLVAASLGSAGFYVTSLMPDIFAPILLLSMAALVAFAPVLRFWSSFGLVTIGMVAVVVHPSHLAIAFLMVPVCMVVAHLFQTGRFWRSMMLVALIPLAGTLERLSFNVAVEQATESDVVYLPFATARLISDGPGLDFLKGVCPSPKWATCALFAKLHSANQLSPEKILFSQTAEDGSFSLLSPDDRKAVSAESAAFMRAVIKTRPFAVISAATRNTLEQLGLVSVKMTIPNPNMSVSATSIYPGFPESLKAGRLIADDPAWLPGLKRAHQAYYLLALIIVLGLATFRKSGVPANLRAFAVLVLIGILANAFVTGAISQPADRYGARVVFLIPMLAVLLWMIRPPRPEREQSGQRHDS